MKNINEIGSFLELTFSAGNEYYTGNKVVRLNTGRAAIFHALRILDITTIYLPIYQCETVRCFLRKYGITIKYYEMDYDFNPQIRNLNNDDAILLVNYFGIMSYERMAYLASQYKNVIIDNSQAFFAPPIEHCLNVYSARKFIGVPDGAYVIGNQVKNYQFDYEQDFSSDTSLFLLQRIEYGCEGKAYESRKMNENRLDLSGVKKMSKLTHVILDGTNYENIKQKRKENYKIASALFQQVNLFHPEIYDGGDCVPMVYPLVLEDDSILSKLIEHKIFQGHWWNYIIQEVSSDSFEYYLSKYMIPITIDQRYGSEELAYMYDLIHQAVSRHHV